MGYKQHRQEKDIPKGAVDYRPHRNVQSLCNIWGWHTQWFRLQPIRWSAQAVQFGMHGICWIRDRLAIWATVIAVGVEKCNQFWYKIQSILCYYNSFLRSERTNSIHWRLKWNSGWFFIIWHQPVNIRMFVIFKNCENSFWNFRMFLYCLKIMHWMLH